MLFRSSRREIAIWACLARATTSFPSPVPSVPLRNLPVSAPIRWGRRRPRAVVVEATPWCVEESFVPALLVDASPLSQQLFPRGNICCVRNWRMCLCGWAVGSVGRGMGWTANAPLTWGTLIHEKGREIEGMTALSLNNDGSQDRITRLSDEFVTQLRYTSSLDVLVGRETGLRFIHHSTFETIRTGCGGVCFGRPADQEAL